MNISVFGLGYVGTVTAACVARLGHCVVGIDVNPNKVTMISEGRSPVIEAGLDALVRDAVERGKLSATADVATAVAHADVILVCVGTPSSSEGQLNLEYVQRVYSDIAAALAHTQGYKVIALRSTVLPGTLNNLLAPLISEVSGKQIGEQFGLVSNPEFLREGSAIEDFNHPPFTLIGAYDERSGNVVEALYEKINAPVFRTDLDTASMVKYASNAFHAVKVTFANEIGRVSKKLNVDSSKVMEIFCCDTQLNISPRYLAPGFAFGGSCLPKDLRALLYFARHNDIAIPVLESVLPSNERQVQIAVEAIERCGEKDVALLGLSFKPYTDDLRESPMVRLAETLLGKGYNLHIYDENVNLSRIIGGNRAYIEQTIPHLAALMHTSAVEAIEAARVVVLAHNINASWLRHVRPDQHVIDLVRLNQSEREMEASYEGLCW